MLFSTRYGVQGGYAFYSAYLQVSYLIPAIISCLRNMHTNNLFPSVILLSEIHAGWVDPQDG
jgi:hypothetical protein